MTTTTEFTLTPDQQAALDSFHQFMLNPLEQVFVLKGNSGCGKSTLVRTLLDRLPFFNKTIQLINPSHKELVLQLTATTNKAAENLSHLSGMEVVTIHSWLGLRVSTNYTTGKTTLIPKNDSVKENFLLFVDEASFMDKEMLGHIFKRTRNCKIVLVGDPAQLINVNAVDAPAFKLKAPGASLTQVVRQAAGNPISDLALQFRDTVNTGKFFNFTPDGHHVKHMSREDFNAEVLKEFTRTNWRYSDSKVLAWTNKRAIFYNNMIREHSNGDPKFEPDDYAVCNSYFSSGKLSVKTDQLVCITEISEDTEVFNVPGNYFVLDGLIEAFMPKTLESRLARLKLAKFEKDIATVARIEESWADLRAAYACTINKAQGSTYDKVFIDLDDISRCNSGDQIARMLYVGVSRARNTVYLTGDLV